MQFPDKMFLTLTELAAWLGMDQKTVRDKARTGKIPAGKPAKAGGQPVWSRTAAGVAAWMIEHEDQILTPPVKPGNSGKSRETPGMDGKIQDSEKP